MSDAVNVPPMVKLIDYPVSIGLAIVIVLTAALLFLVARFDPSGGVLTISLIVTLAFIGATAFCMLFTIPTDESTASLIGGLTAAFGAIVSHWLGRPKDPPP